MGMGGVGGRGGGWGGGGAGRGGEGAGRGGGGGGGGEAYNCRFAECYGSRYRTRRNCALYKSQGRSVL